VRHGLDNVPRQCRSWRYHGMKRLDRNKDPGPSGPLPLTRARSRH
jgi:hypothetical protein